MYKAMRALAIAALVVTILGAGAVLYGIERLEPVVEQVSVLVTPAVEAQDSFDELQRQTADGTFTGRVFGDMMGLNAQDCTFMTVTVRLANKGFFPAEWISLQIQPEAGDVLQLDNNQANVLPSGSRGDIAATILHTGDAAGTRRAFSITCYVFGRRVTIEGAAE